MPWDPSPLRGFSRRTDLDQLRAVLRDRIRRSEYVGVGCQWGFVLCGEPGEGRDPKSYGTVFAITPTDAIQLTPALVRASSSTTLYMLGCLGAAMYVPEICREMGWAEHSPLPAVAVRAVLSCALPMLSGGHMEATIENDQAARTPIVFLTTEPIQGWPR